MAEQLQLPGITDGDGICREHHRRRVQIYDHAIHWGRPHKGAALYDPPLKGRRCRVRARGRGKGPLNVAVELDSGELLCLPRWAVRRAAA